MSCDTEERHGSGDSKAGDPVRFSVKSQLNGINDNAGLTPSEVIIIKAIIRVYDYATYIPGPFPTFFLKAQKSVLNRLPEPGSMEDFLKIIHLGPVQMCSAYTELLWPVALPRGCIRVAGWTLLSLSRGHLVRVEFLAPGRVPPTQGADVLALEWAGPLTSLT